MSTFGLSKLEMKYLGSPLLNSTKSLMIRRRELFEHQMKWVLIHINA